MLAAAIPTIVAFVIPILGGLFWLSIILDAMLVHVAAAALARTIDRRWLLLPCAAILAWLGYTIPDYIAAKTVQARLSQTGLPSNIASQQFNSLDVEEGTTVNTYLLSQWAEASPQTKIFGHGLQFTRTSDGHCSYPSLPAANGIVRWCFRRSEPPPSGLRVIETTPDLPALWPEETQVAGRRANLKSYEVYRVKSAGGLIHIGTINFGTIPYRDVLPLFVAGCFWSWDSARLSCGFQPMTAHLFVNESCDMRGEGLYERHVESILGFPVVTRLPDEPSKPTPFDC